MAYILGMKTLLLAVLVAFCGSLAMAEAPAADLKLKVRWTEKKSKEGKRIVTVFVKNEGMNDLKDVPAEIVLKGKGEKERQTEKVALTVPRNQEKSLEVVVKRAFLDSSGFVKDDAALTEKPVKEIDSIEVVMGESVFASR